MENTSSKENSRDGKPGLLSRAAQLLTSLGFGATDGDRDADVHAKLGKTDFGVLKVAMMIAALDGVILDDEYAAFDKLAAKCRGYSETSAAQALDEALRTAGYLLLKSRRLSEAEIVALLADEAEKALPTGFAYGSVVDVRRAFVMWTAMGMSDGDFSGVERQGILELKRRFAELKREKFAAEIDLWGSLASPYGELMPSVGAGRQAAQTLKLLPDDFLDRAEKLLGRLAFDAYDAGADVDLRDLILNG